MAQLPTLNLADYQYELPEDRIARYPLDDRDKSKLLVYDRGGIKHSVFSELADFLPVKSTLFFNNTKVIPARILFEKPSGGWVEVFLLGPADPSILLSEALNARLNATWKCAIGNAKRWPDSLVLTKQTANGQLAATWVSRKDNLVQFTWESDIPFASIIEAAGAVPLPPYLKRDAEALDKDRYQTVYSKFEGAVAAPTAGLHFTPAVLNQLTGKGITSQYLTLHVSSGTFLPIKVENVADHKMHEEEIIVYKQNIISLLQSTGPIIAVGTTAMRTLESLYWFGRLLLRDPASSFNISQDLPYESDEASVSMRQSLEAVLDRMTRDGIDQIAGHTSIFIRPGYRFRVVQGLLTNFHQPGSTLLLLISAFIGPDWKLIYREALQGGYRFLSYGDSSLLLPVNN